MEMRTKTTRKMAKGLSFVIGLVLAKKKDAILISIAVCVEGSRSALLWKWRMETDNSIGRKGQKRQAFLLLYSCQWALVLGLGLSWHLNKCLANSFSKFHSWIWTRTVPCT